MPGSSASFTVVAAGAGVVVSGDLAFSWSDATSGAELLAKDLKLDTDGDLLVVAGDLVLTRGADAIVQDLTLRLGYTRGEGFLNTERGIPWLTEILGVKNPNLALVRAELLAAIEATPGVLAVTGPTVTLDREARVLSVAFSATTDFGELAVAGTLEIP